MTTVDDLTAVGVITPTEAAETAQALARELPRSLAAAFGPSFIRSCDLYDEFVDRLALRVFRASGLEAATREPGHAEAKPGGERGRIDGSKRSHVSMILRNAN